jgi:hypothetical protein
VLNRLAGLFVAIALALTVGCTTSELRDNPQPLVFAATEYSLAGPDVIPSGYVNLNLTNNGREMHLLQIVEIQPGDAKLPDFVARLQKGDYSFTYWTVLRGGVDATAPGQSLFAVSRLSPGDYMLVCTIRGPDGIPHMAKGMVKALKVTDEKSTLKKPLSDLSVVASDFKFGLSRRPRAGNYVLETVNGGLAVHEPLLVRLQPGKSIQDYAEGLRTGTPAENQAGEVIAGTPPFSVNDRVYSIVELKPGEHGFICLARNEDGTPHYALGMVLQFRVR